MKRLKEIFTNNRLIIGLIIIVTIVFLFILSLFFLRHSFRKEFFGQRENFGERQQFGCNNQGVDRQLQGPEKGTGPQILSKHRNDKERGCGGNIMGNGQPEKKLFNDFCTGGNMINSREFKKIFRFGTQKRYQKMSFIKDNIENIIIKLNDDDKNISGLLIMYEDIRNKVNDFDKLEFDFQLKPEQFCQKQEERTNTNTKIKELMTNLSQEIEKLE